jgi:acetoin utilization deacetylase AcuC-like enzyme
MHAYYADHFVLPLPEGHRFPMRKYSRLRDRLTQELPAVVMREAPTASDGELALVHTPAYIQGVATGSLDAAVQREIGFPWSLAMAERARRSVGATVAAARDALSQGVAGNLAGGTHHAYAHKGGGFCVFNDMAYSAVTFANLGLNVMYVDWDAHHGDGVEELLFDTGIPTMSIHDGTVYPGTGREGHDLEHLAYNWALPRESGDLEFADAMNDIKKLADEIKPDVILLATGADAHETDPLSSLNFTYKGYGYASSIIAEIANKYSSRVLIGGAGGYQPHTHTPAVWAQVVTDIYQKVGK